MRRFAIIGLILILLLMGYGHYHFNVETLMLSELVRTDGQPLASIFLSLLDFDTGLTRHDIRQLRMKGDYWNSRILQVESIPDPLARERARAELTAEMLEDATIRRIVRRTLSLGGDVALQMIKAVL